MSVLAARRRVGNSPRVYCRAVRKKQRALVNRKGRHRFDTEQLWLQLLPFAAVGGSHGSKVNPRSSRCVNILAFILANQACFRRGVIRSTAGFAECHHMHSSAIKQRVWQGLSICAARYIAGLFAYLCASIKN